MAKILIVDDREDNLMSISSLLEPSGYQLVKANSGREALKILLAEYDFALILMDVQMPNLSGFETASLIYEREKLRHIPIIFITAHSHDEENIFKGYKTGAVDYIYKPINPDLLRAKVSVFVELYRKNHQLIAQEQKLIAINKNLEIEINERKNSEEKIKLLNLQLLQNIDKLEAANKDLDRFAFMASHDLQEPLRKINVFSERLDSEYGKHLNEDGRKYINRIQSATSRLQALIKDILTFSKISIDKTVFVTTDLTPLVNDVLHELENIIEEKKATITVDLLPCALINPNLMRPLFYNLIHNSLKYSKKDIPPVIRVFTESESGEGKKNKGESNKYCRIFISDNGIGFEQVFSEQIFDMFKRLHNQNEYEGTGIGLALCKKIVEEHNGFISAKSAVGEGSTFVISLPVTEPEKSAAKIIS
ncbi:MAG: hybrid sensor histidine kinase/response regulator [Cytophagaceae bacterium]|jgi:signal transduction histidine kinase|nr:hybrid sensor histidine kinase/response regulator [Cytophagaceae bacterium]